MATSSDYVFTTTASPDTTAPTVSAGSPTGTLASGVNEATLSVTTDETTTCKYSTTSGTTYGSMTTFSTTGTTAHSQSTGGLSPGAHVYYVKCQDAYSNTSDEYTISFSTSRGGRGATASSAKSVSNNSTASVVSADTSNVSGSTEVVAPLVARIVNEGNRVEAVVSNISPAVRISTNDSASTNDLAGGPRDLWLDMSGEDVTALQKFLISQKIGKDAQELSRVGASGHFGRYTRNALAEYQEKAGIKPASGYFGSITRTYLKSLEN